MLDRDEGVDSNGKGWIWKGVGSCQTILTWASVTLVQSSDTLPSRQVMEQQRLGPFRHADLTG